jgi:DNA repair exonuclease SbcCD ATPase subunit
MYNRSPKHHALPDPMSQDDIDHIPSIVPARDIERPAAGRSSAGRTSQGRGASERPAGSGATRAPSGKSRSSRGGAGFWTSLFLVIALAAAAACYWAWQLREQLAVANETMDGYAQRISDLEDRLSDTDQGMSQNAAVQAAKIRELDSEVRKLWDNVWKKTKERLAKLEASSTSQGNKISAAEKSVSSLEGDMKSATADIARLKSVAGDLDRLMASAKSNQAEVERVADALNRINVELNKLNKRVQGNEESVQSIDAFRRQMMSSITELQAAVRTLETTR